MCESPSGAPEGLMRLMQCVATLDAEVVQFPFVHHRQFMAAARTLPPDVEQRKQAASPTPLPAQNLLDVLRRCVARHRQVTVAKIVLAAGMYRAVAKTNAASTISTARNSAAAIISSRRTSARSGMPCLRGDRAGVVTLWVEAIAISCCRVKCDPPGFSVFRLVNNLRSGNLFHHHKL